MFRKLIISAVAALSLLSPLALTSSTQAHEYQEYRYDFRVFYRCNCNEPWRFAGAFRSRYEAEREVHALHHRGLEAYMR